MNRRYVVRRLLQAVPALGAILVVAFVVVQLMPGDPVHTLAGGEAADPAYLDHLREQYGFDRPLLSQLLTWLGNILSGDFGASAAYGEPVTTIVADRIGPTLLLTGAALALSSAGGIFLGLAAGRRPGSAFDGGVNIATLMVYAVPVFWLAQLAVLFFALRLRVFPITGMTDFRHSYTGFEHVRDVAWHLVLPATVLAASELALVARTTRSGVVGSLDAPFALTALGKGLPRNTVTSRHVLRNTLLPVVTIIGHRMAFLLSGTVVVENVFSWPGLGTVLLEAAKNSDRPLMLGMVVLLSMGVIVANLVTDLVYAWIDPRVRYE